MKRKNKTCLQQPFCVWKQAVSYIQEASWLHAEPKKVLLKTMKHYHCFTVYSKTSLPLSFCKLYTRKYLKYKNSQAAGLQGWTNNLVGVFFLTYFISNLSDNNFICTIHGGLLLIIYIIMADSDIEASAQLDLEYVGMLVVWPSYIRKRGIFGFCPEMCF